MEILDPGRGVLPPLPSPDYADKSVLLASGSPRRRELLHLIVPEFGIAEPREIDEKYPSGPGGGACISFQTESVGLPR